MKEKIVSDINFLLIAFGKDIRATDRQLKLHDFELPKSEEKIFVCDKFLLFLIHIISLLLHARLLHLCFEEKNRFMLKFVSSAYFMVFP